MRRRQHPLVLATGEDHRSGTWSAPAVDLRITFNGNPPPIETDTLEDITSRLEAVYAGAGS